MKIEMTESHVLKKKKESLVEKTAGNEMDEELIDSSIELTESGE